MMQPIDYFLNGFFLGFFGALATVTAIYYLRQKEQGRNMKEIIYKIIPTRWQRICWPCFTGFCKKTEVKPGRRINVQNKNNRPPIRLREVILTCPHEHCAKIDYDYIELNRSERKKNYKNIEK